MATAMDKDITRAMTINDTEILISMGKDGITYRKSGARSDVSISHADIIAEIALKAAEAGNKDQIKTLKSANLI